MHIRVRILHELLLCHTLSLQHHAGIMVSFKCFNLFRHLTNRKIREYSFILEHMHGIAIHSTLKNWMVGLARVRGSPGIRLTSSHITVIVMSYMHIYQPKTSQLAILNGLTTHTTQHELRGGARLKCIFFVSVRITTDCNTS